MEYWIARFWVVVNGAFQGFWDLLCRGHVVRRAIVFFVLALTWESFSWAMDLALTKPITLELAGLIASVLTPLSGLQAITVKLYNDGRKHQKESRDA